MSEVKSTWAHPGHWPYPILYKEHSEVSTDVLVLGGGLAGCFATLAAAKKGLKVTVVDKGHMGRSGCAGGGIDHWPDCCVPGVSKVSPEQLAKARSENHDGYALEEHFRISARDGWDRLLDLEKLGIKIRDTEGEYRDSVARDPESGILFVYDLVSKNHITFWGAGPPRKPKQGMNYAMRREAERLGVKIYDGVYATSLLTEEGKQGGRVVGATGVNGQTGEFYVFKAKATVITTGWVTRLWFYAGNEWSSGWGYQGFGASSNVGDGMVMALRAGAELMNMEASMPSPVSFGSCAGPIIGVSGLNDKKGDSVWPATVIDSTGKPIPLRPAHGRSVGCIPFYLGPGGLDKPEGEALIRLIKEGKIVPPLYLDTPSLSPMEVRRILEVNLGNEGGWVETSVTTGEDGTRVVDADKEMVEVQDPYIPRYGREMKWGGAGGGISIDIDGRTSLEGLCAGGDITPGSTGASGAGVFGWRSGNSAADYAAKAAEPLVDGKQVEAEKARVYGPIERKGGVTWKELNLAIKYIMTTYCNEFKNEGMLKEGLAAFKEVRENEVPKLCAANPHEFMRAVETLGLIDLGEVILHSSLARKASSKSLGFFRLDYPELDPPEWCKWVTVKMEEGEIKIGTKPIKHMEKK